MARAPEPPRQPPRDRLRDALSTAAVAGAFVYPLALPFVLGHRAFQRRVDRRDASWLAAIGLLVASSLVHGRPDPNVFGVLAAWLAYRGARGTAVRDRGRATLERGALVGIALLTAFVAFEAVLGGPGRTGGPPWFLHPNAFAHSWLVLGLGFAIPAMPRSWRPVALSVAMLVLVTTGSRSGLLGSATLLAGMVAVRFVSWRTLGLLSLSAAIAVGIGEVAGATWADRIVGPMREVFVDGGSPNHLVGTEELAASGSWSTQGVEVVPSQHTGPLAVYSVIRTTAVDWARVQQTVTLRAGAVYTWSGEFKSHEGSEPGFLAWGRQGDRTSEIRLSTNADDQGRFLGSVTPNQVRRAALEDDWIRLEATFAVAPDRSVELAFGMSPDLSSSANDRRALVRGVQLERGSVATPYAPASGSTTRGIGEALARVPYWRMAWQGFRESPVFGWGPASFASYYAAHGLEPDAERDPPVHPHNQLLTTAFEGGVLGLLALLATVAALVVGGRGWSRWVLAGVLVANLVDSTLLTTVVLFPLAALVGTDSAAGRRPLPPTGPSAGWGKMKR